MRSKIFMLKQLIREAIEYDEMPIRDLGLELTSAKEVDSDDQHARILVSGTVFGAPFSGVIMVSDDGLDLTYVPGIGPDILQFVTPPAAGEITDNGDTWVSSEERQWHDFMDKVYAMAYNRPIRKRQRN